MTESQTYRRSAKIRGSHQTRRLSHYLLNTWRGPPEVVEALPHSRLILHPPRGNCVAASARPVLRQHVLLDRTCSIPHPVLQAAQIGHRAPHGKARVPPEGLADTHATHRPSRLNLSGVYSLAKDLEKVLAAVRAKLRQAPQVLSLSVVQVCFRLSSDCETWLPWLSCLAIFAHGHFSRASKALVEVKAGVVLLPLGRVGQKLVCFLDLHEVLLHLLSRGVCRV